MFIALPIRTFLNNSDFTLDKTFVYQEAIYVNQDYLSILVYNVSELEKGIL